MKRIVCILYLIALALLSGCGTGSGLLVSRRDMEHLRPIQTIAIDRGEGGVVMGVSSGIGPEGSAPLVMRCAAEGIEPAIARLQSFSPEDELFYAHVRYLLLGDSMSDDSIQPLLDWVERSPSMRMDTAMILVRGSAADTLTGATGEKTDITERLASLEREELARGQHIYSLREIASSLLERGSALCLAVNPTSSEGVIYTASEAADAIVPDGYAVLRKGAPAAYLTPEETLAAELLSGRVNGAQTAVEGNVLELFSTGANASGQWNEDGSLAGVRIHCDLRVGILEREEGSSKDMDALEKRLSEAAKSWLTDVVRRSQEMNCDFLDLESAVRKSAPKGAVIAGDWNEIFSSLPVTVTVKGEIDRNYDRNEGAAS